MKKLVLPQEPQKSLNWTTELIVPIFGDSGIRIGGGTVLAARWNHRRSTDIDLFTDANPAGEFRKKDIASYKKFCEELSSLAIVGTVNELNILDHGCSFIGPYGPVSLHASRRFTRNVLGQGEEDSTGIPTESTREILFKKLYGRVIRLISYVGRDMYDFIVAYMLDPNSLNQALHKLQELNALRYLQQDALSGDIRAREFDRVLEPKYPQLLENINQFNELTAAILSQQVSEQMHERLVSIRDSESTD